MGPREERTRDAGAILRQLRALLDPWPPGLRAEEDEEGHVRLFVARDLFHLDADAMHDRLHHWTLEHVEPALPHASAFVSFRHASPSDPHAESEMDFEEKWLGLEPTFTLDLTNAASPADVERFARLVPAFLARVEARGRPQGFRRPDMGCAE